MSDTENADSNIQLQRLKRERTRARTNITRILNQVHDFNDTTPVEDYEYSKDRLQELLCTVTELDSKIHTFLDDAEYAADASKCDEYIEAAKRAILRTSKGIKGKQMNATTHTTVNDKQPPMTATSVGTLSNIRLPTIKLETFSGDVENWARFWEQFQQSIDQDPTISTIHKHIFLRGCLEGEPKHLVNGIAVISDTYEETKKILTARYGDKNRIIQAHLDYLESIKPIHSPTPESLNSTFIDCNRRIQALRSLGEDVNAYGRVLTPKILRAFPDDICRRWLIHVKQTGLSEGDILQLMQFIGTEIDAALTSQKIRGDNNTLPYTPTAAALHVRANQKQTRPKDNKIYGPFCVFCEERGHWAQECNKITDITERKQKLQSSNRCFLCLNRGHKVSNCGKKGRAFCANCKKQHHKSICVESTTCKSSATQKNVTSVSKIDATTPTFTFLQTAQVRIVGPTGQSKLTRCVLDNGSQASFIAKSLIEDLKLPSIDQRQLSVCTFESHTSSSRQRRLVNFEIGGVWTNSTTYISAYESDHIFTPQPRVPQDIKNMPHARTLQLADPQTDSQEDMPIELLIGSDHYWKIVTDSLPIRISQSIVLFPTIFGWILSGSRSAVCANLAVVNFVLQMPTDDQLRSFWDLETIGITAHHDTVKTNTDAALFQEFQASYLVHDHRRVVRLPKKQNVILCSTNQLNAESRFRSLHKRLLNNDSLKDTYHRLMLDYITKNHVELAPPENPSNPIFYLPHQAVKKEKRGKVKWRVVFDASSHEVNAPSLNSTLDAGPNLLPEILAVLLRFRLHAVAIISDITQAFLQLVLHEEDRDLTRFLWYKVYQDSQGNYHTMSEVTTYRFTRLPFGLTCSPFLLSATLKEHASRNEAKFPVAAQILANNVFMDDFAFGADNDNEAIAMYYELTALMKLLNFQLAKWATTSDQLQDIWKTEGREITTDTQVLGVYWDTAMDSFYINIDDVTEKLPDGPTTKRTVAKFYDPLGLFSPVSIMAKQLFQETWCAGIDWNELLPQNLATRWNTWVSTLPSLSSVHIPRWLSTTKSRDVQIHVFCDASERAYGAALYIRTVSHGNTVIHLVCSKNRLAPVKRITLPRLELLGALVGARLLKYFCTATEYDITHAVLWTDSTVTLGWIRSDPNRWKTFICNRVTEIHTYTSPSQWRHCPGQENPADHLTRGLLGNQIQSAHVWWEGPPWLAHPEECWPSSTFNIRLDLPEERGNVKQVMTLTVPPSLMDISKFSSYWRLIRTTGWILRFIRKIRHKDKVTGELTAAELKNARTYWITIVQRQCFTREIHALQNGKPMPQDSKITRFQPFIEDGLVRLGGRLQFAELTSDQRHPILLDGSHHFTRLLIFQKHIDLHHFGVRFVLSELRKEFWILRGRQTIKRVLHTCLPCKIMKNSRGQQIEAPPPADRMRPSKPFTVTGIDFAGPLFIKTGKTMEKAYIALFTCATTRAVHLELCSSMNTDTFLMAFQRFASRRGLPHTIYTDNAMTFHAANTELLELWSSLNASQTHRFLAKKGVIWKFIAPRASWWGGWWERMVGTVKRCLRKVLGRSSLTAEQLHTTLVSIEAAVNSRPISPGEDAEPLTPAHFLVGEGLLNVPTGTEPTVTHNLTKEFKLRQKLTDDFWKRWTKEYLMELRNFHEVRGTAARCIDFRPGDLALIQEDGRPRHMWRKGKIEKCIHGRDDKVRTIILRTSDGQQIARPVQLVTPLEVDQGGEDVGNRSS